MTDLATLSQVKCNGLAGLLDRRVSQVTGQRNTPQKSACKLPPSKKVQDQGIGGIEGRRGKPGNGVWREREELLHSRVHLHHNSPAKRCRIKVLDRGVSQMEVLDRG